MDVIRPSSFLSASLPSFHCLGEAFFKLDNVVPLITDPHQLAPPLSLIKNKVYILSLLQIIKKDNLQLKSFM